MLTLIAAMSENRVIARGGEMPWHLPADLRHFKSRTMGHPVIMGRRTWKTLNSPLPGRMNIVITRRADYRASGAIIAHDLDEAIEVASASLNEIGQENSPEIFIAGGGEIYALALPRADRLDLTVIHAHLEGDTFFPGFDDREWTLVRDERREADASHAYPFSFRMYERIGEAAP